MEHKDVPFLVHEGIMTRLERTIERLWILAIILILLLVGTNAGWLYYESLYEETVMTQGAEIDTGNGNAYINNGGDMVYGEGESKADRTEKE